MMDILSEESRMQRIILFCLGLAGVWLLINGAPAAAAEFPCTPTAPDSLGPFYKPDAPRRSAVGHGYRLTGTVKSASDCAPVPGATIELWLTNPEGQYDDRHRATVVSDESGGYRFESNPPQDYGFRPPHIHMRITAGGFAPLVTQHYPEAGRSEATFDIVLIPQN